MRVSSAGIFSSFLLARNLYDGQLSLYDLARQSFGGTVCLREHFRCAPEIIQFSNVLSYDRKIKPLRDTSSIRVKPPLVTCCLQDGQRRGDHNDEEALTIASLIVAAIDQPEYDGATFGVIALVGNSQAPLSTRDRNTIFRSSPWKCEGLPHITLRSS